MKIGLIDVDSHNFSNLALMKISAWHKEQGDDVDWWNGLETYNKVYMSKVFDDIYTKDMIHCIQSDEIIKGGTGYGLYNKLPHEIEHMCPDYELYGIKDTAYGFLTRGCPRHCNFCIVGDKEGLRSQKVADLNEFWNGQKYIKLLDPNLLASVYSIELLQQLIDSKSWIDFTQGLDIRIITEKQINMINQLKIKMLHFAWDNYEFKTYDQLKRIRPLLKFNGRILRVYVLVNYNTPIEFDLERIYKLKELDYDPYVMIFNKPKASKEIKNLQRWVNNKFIFRSCDNFENYKAVI